jgi:glycosyltransferase involved in cell wall biosynthesis
MNKGLVSICIPVFNCEKYISNCIDSILSQSYQNIELIIVDNCSTDNTQSKILKYNNSKVKFFFNESNFGIEYNWNKAISLSTGEFVKLMPADDVLNVMCIEKQVEVLNQNNDVVLVGCNRDIINSTGGIIFKPSNNYTNIKLGINEVVSYSILSATNPIGEPGGVLLRKSFLRDTFNFDNSIPYVIDLSFYFNYLENGKCYILNDYLYSFRVSSSSLSVNISFQQRNDFLSFMYKYLKQKNVQIGFLANARLSTLSFINMIGRIFVYRLTNS